MLSRRGFLAQGAAAAAVMVLPVDIRRTHRQTCVVLDLAEHCSLRESLAGYLACHPGRREGSTLARLGKVQIPSFARHDARSARWLIIPGANYIDSPTARLVLTCLEQGGTVLLESGAMFGDFREHRDQMREYFHILLEPPIELWPARGIPYIEYTWPLAARVRDFSRVIPLAPQRGTVVARVDAVPVALARRVGSGTLVFLGSPLGPALWAGDDDARRWLDALLSSGATAQT